MTLLGSNTKLYKITNPEENHYGFQYHDGLNIDHNKFNSSGSCVSGGLYFTTINSICDFFGYGCWLRKITLPFNNPKLRYVKDPDGNKWRANMVILETKYPLFTISTLRMLNKENKNFSMIWTNYFWDDDHSLQNLYDTWKNVYKLDNKKEVYLLTLLLISKIFKKGIYTNNDNIINDNYQCLEDIYAGKYSDIVNRSDLLSLINYSSSKGIHCLTQTIIDKIFNDNDYTESIDQINLKDIKPNLPRYIPGKKVIEWCFEKFTPVEIINLSIQLIVNDCHQFDTAYQEKIDSNSVKQFILNIKQNGCWIDINYFYNAVIFYSGRTNNIELVKFMFETCENIVVIDEILYASIRFLGAFEDTQFLDWIFDKYREKIVNIDKKNLGRILFNAQQCCVLDWWFDKCKSKITSIDSVTIGTILANAKLYAVLNWWFDKCQKLVCAIRFDDQLLTNVYTNANCQTLDFWYKKHTDCIMYTFFSNSILNNIFLHSVNTKNIDKMNWCLEKHIKKQLYIDFSDTNLNKILLICDNNDYIPVLEWIFDKHSKQIFNLTIFPETVNKLIDVAVTNNSVKLLDWIFDIHRIGVKKFNFCDNYLNGLILRKAGTLFNQNNRMYKIYLPLKTYLEKYQL